MVNAAVIGLGRIGLLWDVNSNEPLASTHVLAYHNNPDVHLVAATGTRAAQKTALEQVAPEAQFYTDVRTMLDQHHIDIVSIATPPSVRLSLIRMILEHSAARIIFCEKPVAENLQEAKKIADLMNKYPCMLIPNLSRRWNKGMYRLRNDVREQRYGKLLKMHLRYTRGIYNTGSHLFDLVRFVAGPIRHVKVIEMVRTSLDSKADPSFTFVFTTGESGEVHGYAEAFDDRNYVLFEMDMYFERGKMEMKANGDEIIYYHTAEIIPGFAGLQMEHKEDGYLKHSSNIQQAVSHFVDLLENEAQPICTIEDGIAPLKVAEALITSYNQGGTTEKVGEEEDH